MWPQPIGHPIGKNNGVDTVASVVLATQFGGSLLVKDRISGSIDCSTTWGHSNESVDAYTHNPQNSGVRLKEGFKVLFGYEDLVPNAPVAAYTPRRAPQEVRDEFNYHRLCPKHLKALDLDGWCFGEVKHLPRKWHVAEFLGTSWKILYHNVS